MNINIHEYYNIFIIIKQAGKGLKNGNFSPGFPFSHIYLMVMSFIELGNQVSHVSRSTNDKYEKIMEQSTQFCC